MVSVAKLSNKNVRVKALKSEYEFVLPDTFMGIEVEVDRDNDLSTVFPDQSCLAFWRQHHDGSLVNGYEYTLSMPLSGNMLAEAISQLFAPPSNFTRTFTGSTHIHIDMLEEEVTIAVLRTMVLLVYTLEPMLYAAGDASREWCGYANSLKSAEPLLLSTLFSENVESSFSRVYRRGGSLGRYYGLNLAALTDYGSLEFRYFPTAMSDTELVRWINLVQSFKKAAMDIGTPDMLKNIINDEHAFENMLDTYFADYGNERQALNGWRTVHSFFLKAGIVAKDEMLQDLGGFEQAAFTGTDRYKNTFPELYRQLDAISDFKVVNNGTVPAASACEVGDVLVYGSAVYVYTVDTWTTVGSIMPHMVTPRIIAGLTEVLANHHNSVFEHVIPQVSRLIALASVPSFLQDPFNYPSDSEEEPVDEDDLEDDSW